MGGMVGGGGRAFSELQNFELGLGTILPRLSIIAPETVLWQPRRFNNPAEP